MIVGYRKCVFGLFYTFIGLCCAQEWSYDGSNGPELWPTIGYPTCGGHRQSPVDLKVSQDPGVDVKIPFKYHGYDNDWHSWMLRNNGHSVEVDLSGDGQFYHISGGILLDNEYQMAQFHFHFGKDDTTGSEHSIDGKFFPMEMHMVHFSTKYSSFVHARDSGEIDAIAVLVVMFETSENVVNEEIVKIIDHFRTIEHKDDSHIISSFFLENLIPEDDTAYAWYYGSLTTPPCAETVVWIVFKETLQISKSQIEEFRTLSSCRKDENCNRSIAGNFRPQQELGSRKVVLSKQWDTDKPQHDLFTMMTHEPEDATSRVFNVFGTGFTFKVQAYTGEAIVYLTAVPGVIDTRTFKIVLGEADNQYTSITNVDNPELYIRKLTANILKRDAGRWFWLDWGKKRDGTDVQLLCLGYGQRFDENIIAVLELPLFILAESAITSVALATSHHDTGNWTTYKDSGRYFKLTTKAYGFGYDEFWVSSLTKKYVVFQLKACDDAYILLSEQSNWAHNVYEIRLGTKENTASEIHKTANSESDPVAKQSTPNLLSCDKLQYFWISWDQRIEVGRGRLVGHDMFMEFTEYPLKSIRHLSFATRGPSDGEWHLHNTEDDSFTISIPSEDPSYKYVWIYPKSTDFVFNIRGCEGALLFLAKEPLAWGQNSTGVELMFGSNMDSRLTARAANGTILSSTVHPHLLHCHAAVKFWLRTWSQGTSYGIRLGQGDVPTSAQDRVTILYEDIFDFPVRAISLSAAAVPDNYITWDFDINQAHTVIFDTPELLDMPELQSYWLSVYGRNSFRVKVRASTNVAISLCKVMGGSILGDCYQVLLEWDMDMEDDDVTPMSHIMYSDYFRATYDKSPVLNERYSQWIWMSWTEDSIHVGIGPDVDRDVIMAWTDIPDNMRHDIEALSFWTMNDECAARWEFTELPSRSFEVETYESEGYDLSTWLLTSRRFFSFQLKSCGATVIGLHHTEGDHEHQAYDIQLLIGTYPNEYHRIVAGNGTVLAEILASEANHNRNTVINCDEYEEMWISWMSTGSGTREIAVGHGTLFTNKFLSWTDGDDFSLHFIGLMSVEVQASWIFKDDAAISVNLQTPVSIGEPNWQRNVYHIGSLDHVVFDVQTPHGAILLFDHRPDNNAQGVEYRIDFVAQDNQITLSKGNGNRVLAGCYGEEFVSGVEFKSFWLSWKDSVFRLGKGEVVGERMCMRYYASDDVVSVLYLSAVSGDIFPSHWKFYSIKDNSYVWTHSPAHYLDQVWITLHPGQTMYDFSVRACQDVEMQLTTGGTKTIFSLLIGATAQGRSIIELRNSMGIVVESDDAPDVLSCYEDRHFTLMWPDRLGAQLQLYTGTGDTGRELFSYFDPMLQPKEIRGINFETEADVPGDFTLDKDAGESLRLVQSSEFYSPYCCFWLTVRHRHWIQLSVKAEYNYGAEILLSEFPGVSTGNAYEILIGSGDVIIRQMHNGQVIGYVDVFGSHLDTSKFKSFWISWRNDHVTLGEGSSHLGSEILTYNKTTQYSFNVRGLSLSNSKRNSIEWLLDDQQADNYFHAETTRDIHFQQIQIIPNKQQFIFAVEADSDARIALSEVPGKTTSDAFTIVISKSGVTITDDSGYSEVYRFKGLLNRKELRLFWIRWNRDEGIELGRGNIVGVDPLSSFEPGSGPHAITLADIHAISLASKDEDATWQWLFDQEIQTLLPMIPGHPFMPQVHRLTVHRLNFIILRVKACNKAEFALMANAGSLSDHSRVVLDNHNSLSSLHVQHGQGEAYGDTAQTIGILNCQEYRTFWASWTHTTMSVGTGGVPETNTFLHYKFETGHRVQSVALFNEREETITWQYTAMQGNKQSVKTSADGQYGTSAIVPTWHEAMANVSFSVMACRSAVVTLAKILHNPDEYSIEIIFSELTGQIHVNRKFPDGAEQNVHLHNSESPLLSCHEFREFWLLWTAYGEITLGTGVHVGYDELMLYDDNKLDNDILKINVHMQYISNKFDTFVVSSLEDSAEWILPQVSGDSGLVYTPNVQKPIPDYHNFISVHDGNSIAFTFSLQEENIGQCLTSAYVALSQIQQNVNILTYEIVIKPDKVEIKDSVGFSAKVIESTDIETGICEGEQAFWISWNSRTLMFGSGTAVGADVIVETSNFELEDVTTMSLATIVNKAVWNFNYTNSEIAFTTTTAAPSTSTQPYTTQPTQPTTHTTQPTTEDTTKEDTESHTGGRSSGDNAGIAIAVLLFVALLVGLSYLGYRNWPWNMPPCPCGSAVPDFKRFGQKSKPEVEVAETVMTDMTVFKNAACAPMHDVL